jgi:3-phytase
MRRAPTLIATLVALPVALFSVTATADTGPVVVTTDNETPVLYDDDEGGNASGDDPAIWIHPNDDAKSMVITTAKEGGLRVYNLRNRQVQKIVATPAPRTDGVDGRYNNVDILFGVDLGPRKLDVAVASDRYNDQLRFWRISPLGAAADKPLVEITAAEQEFLFSPDRATVDEEHTAYGVAAWQRGHGRNLAVVTKEGDPVIATAKVIVTDGRVGYTRVRRLRLPGAFPLPDGTTWVPCEEPDIGPQFEGVSVDHRTDTLFAAQEDVGLWRIPLPLGSGEPKLVDKVADFGIHDVYDEATEECEPVDPDDDGYGGTHLVADAEGVDVYYGPRGVGYVIVSSQGDNTYTVYATAGRNKALGTFRIKGRGVDEINGSDGLAVTHRAVGRFTNGMLVTHDEPETGPDVDPDRDATNFSYVHWSAIAEQLGLAVSTRPGNDPRF